MEEGVKSHEDIVRRRQMFRGGGQKEEDRMKAKDILWANRRGRRKSSAQPALSLSPPTGPFQTPRKKDEVKITTHPAANSKLKDVKKLRAALLYAEQPGRPCVKWRVHRRKDGRTKVHRRFEQGWGAKLEGWMDAQDGEDRDVNGEAYEAEILSFILRGSVTPRDRSHRSHPKELERQLRPGGSVKIELPRSVATARKQLPLLWLHNPAFILEILAKELISETPISLTALLTVGAGRDLPGRRRADDLWYDESEFLLPAVLHRILDGNIGTQHNHPGTECVSPSNECKGCDRKVGFRVEIRSCGRASALPRRRRFGGFDSESGTVEGALLEYARQAAKRAGSEVKRGTSTRGAGGQEVSDRPIGHTHQLP
ncbi:hypothetical protein B0H16DRAFT_1472438 [Mycena metata]|uniref:Uncharacterized protein n=1 Tax=Mycena metata TaxID=1033252 RepID=A0AAD7HMX2_9AGAR|nr:hypothetical protein B0H16DRAFT_1472438 [Mycena metata]